MSVESYVRYLKENRPENYGWLDRNIPDMPGHPTVTLFRDQVVRFRNDHVMLLEFIGHVLGKDPKDVCAFDLIAHLLQAAMDAEKSE